MKIAALSFMIFFSGFVICSCGSKTKKSWVFDLEHDLTTRQISKLDSLFTAHENTTSNEIALVTTADYGGDSSIALFGKNFGNKYGVGKKANNNGVVIVFSRAKHETNISTGYGTEKVLTNEIAKRIIDSVMIPEFKNLNYYAGLWKGSIAIIELLERPGNKIK